jgi:hypothetical protein
MFKTSTNHVYYKKDFFTHTISKNNFLFSIIVAWLDYMNFFCLFQHEYENSSKDISPGENFESISDSRMICQIQLLRGTGMS